jgi:hypothetical protein
MHESDATPRQNIQQSSVFCEKTDYFERITAIAALCKLRRKNGASAAAAD